LGKLPENIENPDPKTFAEAIHEPLAFLSKG